MQSIFSSNPPTTNPKTPHLHRPQRHRQNRRLFCRKRNSHGGQSIPRDGSVVPSRALPSRDARVYPSRSFGRIRKGDTETLKLWLSAAQYQVYAALTQQYTTAGLKSDGRILDIRHVDILSARMLENEVPVFIITCRTQEVHVYRNSKTNELAAGMEDKVQLVTYAIGVTRLAEDVNNPDTRGWRLIELQKSARDYI